MKKTRDRTPEEISRGIEESCAELIALVDAMPKITDSEEQKSRPKKSMINS
jgi:hypothetical protein